MTKTLAQSFLATLNEKQKRLFAGLQASELGYFGVRQVGRRIRPASAYDPGGAKSFSRRGTHRAAAHADPQKQQRAQKKSARTLFEKMVRDQTAGSPMHEKVRWTNLKTADLVHSLRAKGCQASRFIVQQLTQMKGLGQRKRSKTLTIKEVERRDEQFQYITKTVAEFKRHGLPILSIVKRKSLSDSCIARASRIVRQRSRCMTTIFLV